MNPAAYGCMLQKYPNIPQWAESRSYGVCLFSGINTAVGQLKSHDCQIYTPNGSRDRTSCDVCLNRSLGYYMKLMVTIKSCCTVSITISNLVIVKSQILLCSTWSNVPTVTQMTQLASMSSICCNIQHLAQPQSQYNQQLSILPVRTVRPSLQAYTSNWQRVPYNDVTIQMNARAAWTQKVCAPLGHCAAYNPNTSLWLRCSMKLTC